jgi:hypothetical protein
MRYEVLIDDGGHGLRNINIRHAGRQTTAGRRDAVSDIGTESALIFADTRLYDILTAAHDL